MPKIGVIGGSGLYNLEGIENVKEVSLDTAFGKPSDNYIVGTLNGVEVAFLSRHGRGHVVNPSEVNYRANIMGMKMLGVEWIISVTACGSLQEEIVPGHMVIIDQFIDRTVQRPATFFEKGIVGHVPFARPLCDVGCAVLAVQCWLCFAVRCGSISDLCKALEPCAQRVRCVATTAGQNRQACGRVLAEP